MILRSSIAGALALAFLIHPTQEAEAKAVVVAAHHVRHHHHVHHHRTIPGSQTPSSRCKGTTYDNDGRTHCSGGFSEFSPSPLEGRGRVWERTLVRHGRGENNESSLSLRGGYARICVAGHCGIVAAPFAERFRGLFAEFIALGYNIGHPGCLSSGHMRHSLHHTGRACDLFNQVGRNRTALRQPPRAVQMEVAARHGLTAGAGWCNPDGGHFDASGYNGCHGGRYYARARRMRVALHR